MGWDGWLAVGGAGSCRRERQLDSGSLVLRTARCLYGAFVVAFSGGGLALSSGGTLNFMSPSSNSSPRGPTSASTSLIRRMATRSSGVGDRHDQPKPAATSRWLRNLVK